MRKAGAPGMGGYNVAEILAVRIFFEPATPHGQARAA
jgi:hypothetical protein